jgi:hypothetical protein
MEHNNNNNNNPTIKQSQTIAVPPTNNFEPQPL